MGPLFLGAFIFLLVASGFHADGMGQSLASDFPTEELVALAGAIPYGKAHMDATALKTCCLKVAASSVCLPLVICLNAVSYWKEVHALQIA